MNNLKIIRKSKVIAKTKTKSRLFQQQRWQNILKLSDFMEYEGLKLKDHHCICCGEEYNTTTKIQCVRWLKWFHETYTNNQVFSKNVVKFYAKWRIEIIL